MGWMRTLFMGDIGQNLEIDAIQARLDEMRDKKTTVDLAQDTQITVLRGEIHDLKLRLAVLIKLLVGKNVLTAAEIATMIAAVEPEG